jgi:hypothetical protein
MGDAQAEAAREFFGLAVEHDERDQAVGSLGPHHVPDLTMAQQVVADVSHVPEVPHPPVHAEQVERRGRHEVNGPAVRPEELS